MLLCRKAAEFLGLAFKLTINGTRRTVTAKEFFLMNTSALHSALLTVSAYKDVLRTPVMSTVLRLLSVLTRGQGGGCSVRLYRSILHAASGRV